jgi:hypothetical protein
LITKLRQDLSFSQLCCWDASLQGLLNSEGTGTEVLQNVWNCLSICNIISQQTWIFDKIELWIREAMEGNTAIFLNVREGTVLKFFHGNKIEHCFHDLTVKCGDWIRYPFLTCDDYTGP